ncbi:nitroreductase family protein [Nocardioides alcanivorans]|uniref:nitroreductase family protein n=1 Tax=Nocardioides alcanivorans TaxID=2897352 RepID=UPI001F2AD29A|nr:nitroreductase family protein [Nocardioides alcanivorans]
MTTELTGDLSDVLRNRRSLRILDPEHVLGDAQLARLLRAAQWSPSAGNSQPWGFLVACRGDETHDRFVKHLSAGNRSWVPAASAVLITAHQVASGPEDDAPAFSDYAMYDLGQAAAMLTVEAGLLGLTAHQFAGFDHDGVAEEFGVPEHWRVTTAIAIGTYGDPSAADPALVERDRRPRVRKELSEFVFAGTWGASAGL